jgi:hypothetical protein
VASLSSTQAVLPVRLQVTWRRPQVRAMLWPWATSTSLMVSYAFEGVPSGSCCLG